MRKPAIAKAVAAKDKPAAAAKNDNQPDATKDDADQDKDENGFVKPDFSDMEKYFEIVKSEY